MIGLVVHWCNGTNHLGQKRWSMYIRPLRRSQPATTTCLDKAACNVPPQPEAVTAVLGSRILGSRRVARHAGWEEGRRRCNDQRANRGIGSAACRCWDDGPGCREPRVG